MEIDNRPAMDANELRARLAEARDKATARRTATLEAIELRRMEGELKLCEIEETEGLTREVDCAAIYSPRDGSIVIVRTPAEAVFQRFQTRMQSDKVTAADFEALVRPCLVYPDKAGLNAIVEAAPGMLVQAANACARLAGASLEVQQGK